MNEASVAFSVADEDSLSLQVNGEWRMETDIPSTETMLEQLSQHPSIKRVVFDAAELGSWDSSLLIFFFEISKLAAERKIQVDENGLPAGVRQLIQLATAVPKKEDARQSVSRVGFFARVGTDVIDFYRSAGDLVTFIGAAFVAFARMLTGRARFRASDLGLFLQEAGAQAVPPMEFLVLPRVVALTLMMPFLVLYANFMGILGGALVAVGMYHINILVYLNRTKEAIGLNDLFIGLFMSAVFGILVALSGCLRGMQCGRSASAVGDAATSAVVTGIVSIIIATAIITVVCSILGI